MRQSSSFMVKVRNAFQSKFGLKAVFETVEVLGRQLTLRAGTVRREPDYDDAWHVLCLLHAKVVFDVGANIGQGAVLAALIDSISDVVLFEANPDAMAIASENLIRNHLIEKTRLVCAYAGREDKTNIRFWSVGSGAAGSSYSSHAKTAAKLGKFFDVPVVTLDSVSTRYDLLPDFVKIDVEGAEMDVLAGSNELASRMKTRFLVEMHSNKDLSMKKNCEALLEWAQQTQYCAWYLSTGEHLSSPAQIAHRGRCHLLLQPIQWPYPDWLIGVRQSSNPEHFLKHVVAPND